MTSLVHKIFFDLFVNDKNVEVELNKDLRLNTTLRLNSKGTLVTVSSISGLKKVVQYLSSNSISYLVIGMGANVVLSEIVEKILIKINFPFNKENLSPSSKIYELPASVSLSLLTSHAIKFGLKGWEVFTGVPATLGGATFMNAGTVLGEISSIIHSVHILRNNGTIEILEINKNHFCYRGNNFLREGDIIFQVDIFHNGIDNEIPSLIKGYLKKRRNSQPLDKATCGCVYKNKKGIVDFSVGATLDMLGLKGLGICGLKISNEHANFIENSNNADIETFEKLLLSIDKEVFLNFGINFDREVKFLK